MAAADPDVALIDVTSAGEMDLTEYDRIGIASGVYYNSFAKQVLSCAENYLPEAPEGGSEDHTGKTLSRARCLSLPGIRYLWTLQVGWRSCQGPPDQR